MKKNYIDTSSIGFEKVIIHTLPKHKKGDTTVQPTFSEKTSQLTLDLKSFFKDKIVSAFNSDKALKLLYNQESTSPIPVVATDIIKALALKNETDFVKNSKAIAQFLFDIQKGNNNEGILIVVPAVVGQKAALLILKLEMDSGAQLIMNEGTQSFDINAVEDLMLTRKTKVYKVALLLKKNLQNVGFDAIVADHQIDMKAKMEVKSWFINDFLGCKPFKDPKIITQDFYNYTKAFIDTIDDDLKRAKYTQDLNSYLRKNTTILSAQEFADDYLLTAEKNQYRNYLLEKAFDMDGFQKDITQIEGRIQKMTLEFANGIVLTSKSGNIDDKVKLEKTEEGQTKATITSRVSNIR